MFHIKHVRWILAAGTIAAAVTAPAVASANHDEPEKKAELEGPALSPTGTCPNLTFNVKGTRVVTSNATRYEDGACANVTEGRKVDIEGTRQPDGSIVATKIDLD